jgi:hypothetical protein
MRRREPASGTEEASSMRWRNWTRNLSAKLLSFFFALALWLSVTNQIDFEEELAIPIEYVNRPEGLTSIQALPDEVRAQVRGKGRFLRIQLRDAVCRIDLSGNQAGLNTIAVSGANVVLPSDAKVARIEVLEPKRILAEFDETVIRDIPVTPTVVGTPSARHVQVGKTFVNPPAARVKGPRKLVDQIALVSTDEVDLEGNRNTVRKKVKLLKSFGPTVEITPETVEVGITIEPIILDTIERVAVSVGDPLPESWAARVQPESVAVRVSGARSYVESAAAERSGLVLTAPSWRLGSLSIEVDEVRDGRLVFRPVPPLPGAPPRTSSPAADSTGAGILGDFAVAPDVVILGIEPDRLLVVIQRARGADASGESTEETEAP